MTPSATPEITQTPPGTPQCRPPPVEVEAQLAALGGAQRQLELMLQNLMEELVWRRVADVLREATSQALENAERAYERSQVCRRELTSLRHAVP